MESDVLVQRLEAFLRNQSGTIQIDAEKLKTIIQKVKSLETALADVLRLTHTKSPISDLN